MTKKQNYIYQQIEDYLNNLKYTLITKLDDFLNANQKVIFKDSLGYKYYLTYKTLQTIKKLLFAASYNPFSIDNIKLWCNLNNKPFELISDEYISINKNLKWKCLKDINHNIWESSWHNIFFSGTGCPKCNRPNYDRTTESFKIEVYNLTEGDFEVLGEYINNSTDILMYHKSCDYMFNVKPATFLHKNLCPKCSITGKKNTEIFKERVYDLIKDEYEVIGEYIGTHKHIKIKHNICNNEYNVQPSNFLRGRRCPFCAESKGEQKIRHWLVENNICFLQEYDKFLDLLSDKGNPLRFDFIVFEDISKSKIKMLIEFDGAQHFKWQKDWQKKEDFETLQYHDKLKNNYCETNNIKLLRIPYNKYEKVDKILNKNIL
jgi:hypothetical protein